MSYWKSYLKQKQIDLNKSAGLYPLYSGEPPPPPDSDDLTAAATAASSLVGRRTVGGRGFAYLAAHPTTVGGTPTFDRGELLKIQESLLAAKSSKDPAAMAAADAKVETMVAEAKAVAVAGSAEPEPDLMAIDPFDTFGTSFLHTTPGKTKSAAASPIAAPAPSPTPAPTAMAVSSTSKAKLPTPKKVHFGSPGAALPASPLLSPIESSFGVSPGGIDLDVGDIYASGGGRKISSMPMTVSPKIPPGANDDEVEVFFNPVDETLHVTKSPGKTKSAAKPALPASPSSFWGQALSTAGMIRDQALAGAQQVAKALTPAKEAAMTVAETPHIDVNDPTGAAFLHSSPEKIPTPTPVPQTKEVSTASQHIQERLQSIEDTIKNSYPFEQPPVVAGIVDGQKQLNAVAQWLKDTEGAQLNMRSSLQRYLKYYQMVYPKNGEVFEQIVSHILSNPTDQFVVKAMTKAGFSPQAAKQIEATPSTAQPENKRKSIRPTPVFDELKAPPSTLGKFRQAGVHPAQAQNEEYGPAYQEMAQWSDPKGGVPEPDHRSTSLGPCFVKTMGTRTANEISRAFRTYHFQVGDEGINFRNICLALWKTGTATQPDYLKAVLNFYKSYKGKGSNFVAVATRLDNMTPEEIAANSGADFSAALSDAAKASSCTDCVGSLSSSWEIQ